MGKEREVTIIMMVGLVLGPYSFSYLAWGWALGLAWRAVG